MLPPGRHHRCVLLRRRTSSDCWLSLAILPTSSTSLQSLPKAGSPGTRGVNRHHVIIVPAWQQTISACHKFSWRFLCTYCPSGPVFLCPYIPRFRFGGGTNAAVGICCCTSLQSPPKAGSPGARGVNLHRAIIVRARQRTASAFHKFSWPFLCA